MTRREQIRNKRAQQERQQNFTILAILGGAALLIVAMLAWPSIRDSVTPADPVKPPVAVTYKPELVDGKNYGPANAKVIVREYADFQCPYCGLVAAQVTSLIKDEFISSGQSVRFEFRHFIVVDPVSSNGESRSAAEASECAASQGKFWQFHDYVFANQNGENRGGFRDANLRNFAQSAGLDLTAYDTCFNGGQFAQAVTTDEAEARALALTGTPSMFVNDVKITDPLNYEEVKATIQAALAAP